MAEGENTVNQYPPEQTFNTLVAEVSAVAAIYEVLGCD